MIKAAHTFIPFAGLAAATMLVSAMNEYDAAEPAPPPDSAWESAPLVHVSNADVECVGVADCRARAARAYKLAVHFTEHADADITNRYLAYKHFGRADVLLARADVEPPPRMRDISEHQARLEGELDDIFRRSRVDYHQRKQRHMYREMARELADLKAFFPDRQARYHIWATQKEREMRENGTYPREPVR